MAVSQRPMSMPILTQVRSPPIAPIFTGRRKPSRNFTPNSIQALKDTKRLNHDGTTNSVSCSFSDLIQNNYFATNYSLYTCIDVTFGTFICHIASNGANLSGHVYCFAGSYGFMNFGIDHEAFAHLGSLNGKSQILTQGLATLIYKCIAGVPEEMLRRLGWSATSSVVSAAKDATRLASSLEAYKDFSITEQIQLFLASKSLKKIDFDLITTTDGPLHTLLPNAIPKKDKNAEANRIPAPPRFENASKRENLYHEIIATERTYVSRLQHLLRDYALPLRSASRKQKGILGLYETNALFPTSLDAIVLLNQDFLKSLEATSGDFEFALTLANAFRDFRKVYARYLETSSDLDQILRSAMKVPRFKEFTDGVRSSVNANIGIRELVMEPISRIPRYSLLISSLLGAITEANPAYQVLKEALITVRRIGLMERDHIEASQEIVMKLAALVASWPADLVKSSIRVISHVDCLDMMPARLYDSDGANGGHGNLCSLILCSDRLVILKRARNLRLEEILSLNKKGELGFRGYVPLDKVRLFDSEDSLHLVLQEEVTGVTSERWLSRPYRRMALMTADADNFARHVDLAKAERRQSEQNRYLESYKDTQIEYHVYNREQWTLERYQLKSDFQIWLNDDDLDKSGCNFVIEYHANVFSCEIHAGARSEMLCRDVCSGSILKEAIHEKARALQNSSWLSPSVYDVDMLIHIHQMFLRSLIPTFGHGVPAMVKSRPTSPSKIMSSFLGKLGDGTAIRPKTPAPLTRTDTEQTDRTFSSHMISKKKSIPLFTFGSSDERHIKGVEVFAAALLAFENFTENEFHVVSARESKQASALASMIAKDSKKGFAISGSPSKVAIHAFRLYCQTTLVKKLGCAVLPDPICSSLKSYLKTEVDIRRNRFRAVLKGLPRVNLGLLKTILNFGRHLVSATEERTRIKALLTVNEMLVSIAVSNSFVSTLEVLLNDFDHFFAVNRDADQDTINSTTSGLTLPPSHHSFGSLSSISKSCYNTDAGTLSPLPKSPTKHSAYSMTPDLVHGTSSTEDSTSLHRSRSGSSATLSLNSEARNIPKRATNHRDHSIDLYDGRALAPFNSLPTFPSLSSNVFDSRLSLAEQQDISELSAHFDIEVKARPTVNDTGGPELTTPALPDSGNRAIYEESTATDALVSNPTRLLDSLTRSSKRVVTPSKIPIPSPRLNYTPSHSRDVSTTMEVAPLFSRKTTSIVRLPTLLVQRKNSQGLTKSFSNHSFEFDSNLAADFATAMRYSSSDMLDGDKQRTASSLSGSSTEAKLTKRTERRPSREKVRREIADSSRMSSMATIRRVSRQLQTTSIGPLDLRTEPRDVTLQTVLSSETNSSLGKPEYRVSDTACNAVCAEQMDNLRLELEHYKAAYRSATEEIDVTLDLANEQIEELQVALKAGTLEATAISMLELEKERNRQLMSELAKLREKREM